MSIYEIKHIRTEIEELIEDTTNSRVKKALKSSIYDLNSAIRELENENEQIEGQMSLTDYM